MVVSWTGGWEWDCRPVTIQTFAKGDFGVVVPAPFNRWIWTSCRLAAQRHIGTLTDNNVTGRNRVVYIGRHCNGEEVRGLR